MVDMSLLPELGLGHTENRASDKHVTPDGALQTISE